MFIEVKQPGAGELVTEVRRRALKITLTCCGTDDQLKENSKYEYGYVENYEIVDRGNQTQLNLEECWMN